MDIEKLLEESSSVAKRSEELDRLIAAPEIIADNRYWRRLVAKRQSVADIIETRTLLQKVVEDRRVFGEWLQEDASVAEEIKTLSARAEELAFRLRDLLWEAEGNGDAAVELIAGGNKALAFCGDILLAYQNFCTQNGFRFSLRSEADERGIKRAVLFVEGGYASFRPESGLHKGITENGTVTVQVTVFPKIASSDVALSDKDIKIDLFHSGGAGGQNINKVETAIRMTHLPTGIVVTCQDERSQLQNKRKALDALKKKLALLREAEEQTRKEEIRKSVSGCLARTYYYESGYAQGNRKAPLSRVFGGEICLTR